MRCVAADVARDVAADAGVHDAARFFHALVEIDGIALGPEAREVIGPVLRQRLKPPGLQGIGEALGQGTRCEDDHVVEEARHPARDAGPAHLAHAAGLAVLAAHGDVVGGPALAGVAGARVGVIGPVGHVDAVHLAALLGVFRKPVGREPEPPEPAVHRVMGLSFGQLEGDDALRLDMPVGAGIGDQRGGAEGAFLGVDLCVEGDLRAAIVALGDAGFLHLGGIEAVAQRGAEIELPDATVACSHGPASASVISFSLPQWSQTSLS
jgi:hypothetical protein